jgi:hypothetical protein
MGIQQGVPESWARWTAEVQQGSGMAIAVSGDLWKLPSGSART